MDLNQAILAHSKWKTRLQNFIQGNEQLNPEMVGKDNQCDLGKWIYGEGSKYASLSQFSDLKTKHAKFHAAAANVVRNAKSCTPEKALEMLDPLRSEYGKASFAVINAIATLKNAVDAG